MRVRFLRIIGHRIERLVEDAFLEKPVTSSIWRVFLWAPELPKRARAQCGVAVELRQRIRRRFLCGLRTVQLPQFCITLTGIVPFLRSAWKCLPQGGFSS